MTDAPAAPRGRTCRARATSSASGTSVRRGASQTASDDADEPPSSTGSLSRPRRNVHIEREHAARALRAPEFLRRGRSCGAASNSGLPVTTSVDRAPTSSGPIAASARVAQPRAGQRRAPARTTASTAPASSHASGRSRPGGGEQHEHRRAAPRALDLEHDRPDDQREVRDVDVARRGEDLEVEAGAAPAAPATSADDRRRSTRAEPVDARRRAPRTRRSSRAPSRGRRRRRRASRPRRRRSPADARSARGSRRSRQVQVQQVAAPQQRVERVVVRVGRDRRSSRSARRARAREPSARTRRGGTRRTGRVEPGSAG